MELNDIEPKTIADPSQHRKALVMRPAARHQWLLDRLRASPVPLDILNTEFVDAFIEATTARFMPVLVGAHRCPMLGRDLSHVSPRNAATRAVGRSMWRMGNAPMGLPV